MSRLRLPPGAARAWRRRQRSRTTPGRPAGRSSLAPNTTNTALANTGRKLATTRFEEGARNVLASRPCARRPSRTSRRAGGCRARSARGGRPATRRDPGRGSRSSARDRVLRAGRRPRTRRGSFQGNDIRPEVPARASASRRRTPYDGSSGAYRLGASERVGRADVVTQREPAEADQAPRPLAEHPLVVRRAGLDDRLVVETDQPLERLERIPRSTGREREARRRQLERRDAVERAPRLDQERLQLVVDPATAPGGGGSGRRRGAGRPGADWFARRATAIPRFQVSTARTSSPAAS